MNITLVIAVACILQNVSVKAGVKTDTISVIHKSLHKPTTLDSMQGNWVNSRDVLDKIFVKGRSYHELYISRKDTLANDYYTIYFSDTLAVTGNFKDLKIDTTLKSGNYLILRTKPYTDGGFWCYRIDGFFFKEPVPYFLITDTWAKRRETAFEKVETKRVKVR